ncbi:PREDICTED: RING finger protein 148-like [Ipomoea nil]|uniref:RING finger protein 148-like n=1 Tax=Ipomoea nil TaxID=35883 RepID=UPI000901891E|nr:PREDICTED: RING finger protein 148-like [Ipomoea nil]
MDYNFFQCHKHTLLKSYKLGKPWRPHKCPPISSSSSQSDSHYLSFEFCWQTVHRYFNLPDETPNTPCLIKTRKGCEGIVSILVDGLEFLNDNSYALRLVDSLVSNSKFRAWDLEAAWIVSVARIFLQANPHLGTMLIDLQVVRDHYCYESVLVRNVMERSLEVEMGVVSGLKPASKASLELLKRVDFDEADIDDHHNCVVCQDELFSCKEKEVVDMPCSHMFHGECILQWLQISHRCPICRFKMPTI